MSPTCPSEADCKRVGPQLDRIVEQIIPYAERKRFLGPLIENLQNRVPDLSDYPEEWSSMVVAMLGTAAVTTVPKRTQGFIRSVQSDLATAELRIAKQWRRVPWAFVAFEEIEPLEHDILLVDPIGGAPSGWPADLSWDRLPIYSPSLADGYSRGVRSGLALIAYDGAVFHTYGVILQFASFGAEDLLYFAAVAADDTTDDELAFLLGKPEDVPSLSEIIRKDPVPFMMLFRWQEHPTLTGRRGPWRYCASIVTYQGDKDLADESLWQQVISEGDEVIQDFIATDEIVGLRLGDDTPMYEPLILVSLEDHAVYVRAMTEEAYARGVSAIAPLVAMPREPQVGTSMLMMHAAEEILDPVDLLSDLEAVVTETFDDAADVAHPIAESDGDLLEDGAEPPPDLSGIQAVLSLLMENFNEGRDYTDEMIAEKTGTDVEQVRMLREQVMEMVDRAPGGQPGTSSTTTPRITAADRFGLPPGPFHRIMSTPIPAEEGVLALRDLRGATLSQPEEEALLEVPLFRFAQWMLELEAIPATAAGYVAPKVVRRAIEEEIVPRYHDAWRMDLFDDELPKKEIDAPVFNRYREILESARLIRLDGKQFVSKESMKDVDLGTIVSTIVEAMFRTARWDDNRYGSPVPWLRESAGFLLYVLKQLSADAPEGWVPVTALYDAFLGAHPQIAETVTPDDLLEPGTAGWWVFLNIHVNFVVLFGETLGIIEGDKSDSQERYANGKLPDLDSYQVRLTRRFSILF